VQPVETAAVERHLEERAEVGIPAGAGRAEKEAVELRQRGLGRMAGRLQRIGVEFVHHA
jgi:hypothetical protein